MSKYDHGSAGRKRIKIQNPAIQSPEEEKMWREVAKFAELIPSEPDPNFGRLDEIKEEIKKGTYLNSQVIEETAARLAIRFTQRE
jgi:hypothetical protein